MHPAGIVDSYDTLSRIEIETALKDSLVPDSNDDAITAQLLERARQHYLSALEAEQEKDSIHAANEFEYSIGILNELGYYPNIETNCDFNDLSHSVVEDYQKYIAQIDSLGPNTSIFALRNKLDQIDEMNESADQDKTKEIITTTSIPLIINGHVEQNIAFFRGRGRAHFEHWLYESGKYFPIMRKVFRDEGVPEELVYLSMIESGMNPIARSWARAVGLWQFVKGTGQLYGLHANFWVDERRDFHKATNAAAHHLKDLYSEYGDWYLVLAAYNSGAGRVNSAMRRSGSSDFWRMRPFLPRETRNYVPQYIAAAVMSLNPRKYGFDITPTDTIRYDNVVINDCVDLSVLAKCAGTDPQSIRELNPELVQWCTPPGTEGYLLHLPSGSAMSFTENYKNIPDNQKHDWVEHKVKRRETLSSIARHYAVPASLIANANHLKSNRLPVGKSIVIPVPGTGKQYLASLAEETSRKNIRRNGHLYHSVSDPGNDKTKLTYKIRKGDSLGKIAGWYDVRVSDLRVWNEIPYGSSIRAGNVLTIWVPRDHIDKYSSIDHLSDADHVKLVEAKGEIDSMVSKPHQNSSSWTNYRVKKGDTLAKIALRYNVAQEDIQKWNGMSSDQVLKGQNLDILVEDSATSRTMSVQQDTSKNSGKTISYRVKRGDTLLRIASNFGVSIRQLRNWNNLRGSRLHVGQAILINS
jgi:membrane-bound lytic murein transglycosylase D